MATLKKEQVMYNVQTYAGMGIDADMSDEEVQKFVGYLILMGTGGGKSQAIPMDRIDHGFAKDILLRDMNIAINTYNFVSNHPELFK